MNYDDDPSIIEQDGRYFHRPGGFLPKLIYLLVGSLVLLVGWIFTWDIAGRLLLGQQVTARVVRIEKVIPGVENEVYRYRREYEEEDKDRSITFQHYVAVQEDGKEHVLRLGVDCRVKPYCNVNDRIEVAYYPGEDVAFATWHARSWGMGLLYLLIGVAFVGTGIPMLWTANRLVEIDPEAPPEDVAPDKVAAEREKAEQAERENAEQKPAGPVADGEPAAEDDPKA
jgi:hypothetical protein